MMAPRSIVDGSIFTQRQPSNAQIIADLRTELHHAHERAKNDARVIAMLEAELAIIKKNLMKPRIVPTGDCEDGYYCPNRGCVLELTEDYAYCPGCGCEIDWRTRNEV